MEAAEIKSPKRGFFASLKSKRLKEAEDAIRQKVTNEVGDLLLKHMENKEKPRKNFVGISSMQTIWTRERLKTLSTGLNWNEDTVTEVQKSFIKVLSILVWIKWKEWDTFLELFLYRRHDRGDSSLPFDHQPDFLSGQDSLNFFMNQYAFCPAILQEGDDGDQFPADQRLPFTDSCPIGEGAYGKVTKELVAAKHFKSLEPSKGFNDFARPVACKIIKGSFAERRNVTQYSNTSVQLFVSEQENIQKFRSCLHRNDNMAISLATFMHGENFVIISDLADLDLDNFLTGDKDRFPDFEQRRCTFLPLLLLKEAASLAGALHFIHNDLEFADNSGGMSCAHLDLKPDNVLVVWGENGKWGPVGRWKLHDFGLSRIKTSSAASRPDNLPMFAFEDGAALDAVAPGDLLNTKFSRRFSSYEPTKENPREFTAPELTYGNEMLGVASDMWSYGAIVCVLLAFIVGGPSEVEHFRRERLRDGQHKEGQTYGYDNFYYRNPKDHSLLILKPSVKIFLDTLAQHADQNRRKWISGLRTLILKMLTIDPVERAKFRASAAQEGLKRICNENSDSLNNPFDWTTAPAPPLVKTTGGTSALKLVSTSGTAFPTPSSVSSKVGSPGSISAASTSDQSSNAGSIDTSLITRQPALTDDIVGFIAVESPKQCSNVVWCHRGTSFALFSPKQVMLYRLHDQQGWTKSKPKHRSLPIPQFQLPHSGAEWNRFALAGNFVVVRVKANRNVKSAEAYTLYRYQCTDEAQNLWQIENLSTTVAFAPKNGKSLIENSSNISVSCHGDILFAFGNVVVSFSSRRKHPDPSLKELIHFPATHLIEDLAFSHDGLFIYCWSRANDNSTEIFHIWHARSGLLKRRIGPLSGSVREIIGSARRNVLIPCPSFFITVNKQGAMQFVGQSQTEPPKTLGFELLDVVAGAYHGGIGGNPSLLVLLKNSKTPARSTLLILRVFPDNTVAEPDSVPLNHYINPDKESFVIVKGSTAIFAICCHVDGLIEKVRIFP